MALRAGRSTTFKVNFAPTGAGPRQATVTILSNTEASPTLVTVSGTGVIPLPDLTIQKTASPNPVTSGGTLTYTLTVQNIGNAAATAVTVSDALPAGVSFQRCSVACSVSGNTVSVSLGSLAAGGTTSFNIVVVAPIVATTIALTNNVTVSTPNDANPGNNSTSQVTSVTPTTTFPQRGGPPGAFINDLNIFPLAPNVLFAAAGFSLLRSADAGQTWSPVGEPPYGIPAYSLARHPQQPARLLAGMLYPGAVYQSTDGGSTWSRHGFPFSGTDVLDVAFDPTNPAVIYAGTGSLFSFPAFGRVFKSTDGGTSWVQINNGLPSERSIFTLAVSPSNPDIVFAGTDGLYKTTNGGQSWNRILPAWIESIVIHPSNPSVIYAAGYGEYKSLDGGESWIAIAGAPSRLVKVLAVHPTDPNIVYAGTSEVMGTGGIYRSIDGGASWAAVNVGVTNREIRALAVDPLTPSVLYAGSHGAGVFKSTDGGSSWTLFNAGMNYTQVSSLVFPKSQNAPLFVGTYGAGVFKTLDQGTSWISLSSALSGPRGVFVTNMAADANNASVLYAATNCGGVYKTSDLGQTWTYSTAGLTDTCMYGLAVDPFNSHVVYAGGEKLFKSTDGGSTWAASGTGISGLVWDLEADPQNQGVIYAGTLAGGVFKSLNAGLNWVAVNSGLYSSSSSLAAFALAIHPANPSVLYVGIAGGGVFKTTNAGQTWAPMNIGLPQNARVSDFAFSPTNPDVVFTVANSRVFKSLNGGQSWVPTGDSGLSPFSVERLAINPNQPATLFGATRDAGVFRSTDEGATWQPTSPR